MRAVSHRQVSELGIGEGTPFKKNSIVALIEK